MAERKHIAKYSGLRLKDYIGYALGDVGCCLVFSLNTSLLQNYYTDALFLNPIFIMVMFVVARVWDAINDPIMGRIVDRMKPNKMGKFKRWFIYGGLPLMIASILMFIQLPGMIDAGKQEAFIGAYVFATITYILFGMMYTAVQIPYGSLASVVTADEKERSKLSIFRSVGSALGCTPILILNMFTFFTDPKTKRQEVNYTILIIGVVVMAICSFIAMFAAYKMNKERVPVKPVPHEKGSMKAGLKRIFKTRSMIVLCVIGMLLLAQSMFGTSYFGYVLRNYYQANGPLAMIPSLISQFMPILLMFVVPPLAKKFGKKEVSAIGMIIALVANITLFLLVFIPGDEMHSNTLIWFYILNAIVSIGTTPLTLQIWSMIADCIDDMQVKNGIREDGSSYAVFMFFRKFGQIICAITVNCSLLAMGYNFAVQDFSSDQIRLMYILGTVIPIAMLVIIAYLLMFRYPLNKAGLEKLQDEKEAFFAKEEKKQIATKSKGGK
ncbi:MAG: MFS transporter [Bacilli bacterium]|nr:MFS transporter [Bacilli bacterium]